MPSSRCGRRCCAASLPLFAVMVLIGGLLLLEPDFGAFVVIVAIAFGILFLGGLDWRLFARPRRCCCRSRLRAILIAAPYRVQRLDGLPGSVGRSVAARATSCRIR